MCNQISIKIQFRARLRAIAGSGVADNFVAGAHRPVATRLGDTGPFAPPTTTTTKFSRSTAVAPSLPLTMLQSAPTVLRGLSHLLPAATTGASRILSSANASTFKPANQVST